MDDHDRPPPPTLRRLHEQGAGVECRCRTCRRIVDLDVADLAARAGWSTPFPEARKRLRCGACGSRAVDARPLYPGTPGVVTRHT